MIAGPWKDSGGLGERAVLGDPMVGEGGKGRSQVGVVWQDWDSVDREPKAPKMVPGRTK